MDSMQKKLSPLDGLADKVVGIVFDCAASKIARLWNIKEEADKLRRTAERIRALLTDAEERRYIDDDSIKLWLRDLKAVAFDVDSLLDHFNTVTAVSRQDIPESPRKRKRSWLSVPQERWQMDAKIAEINARLEDIYKARKNFTLRAEDARRRARPGQWGQRARNSEAVACFTESAQIIGRTKEKEEIVRVLLSDHATVLPVVSIYGAAGIGKTALARAVYVDAEVQRFFDIKIWVCLSDKCDVRRATKMIIEAVTKRRCDLLSLDILQQQLREHLSTSKFLLVIDNLWAEDYEFWESLRRPLLAGEKGSRVLITTRNRRVWRRTTTILPINLKGLGDEDCWLLLRDYAFSQGRWMGRDDLVTVGRCIAVSCQGSPLAAKSLGMLLSDCDGDEEEWRNILREMQVLADDKNMILPSLQISYHHLPYHLKQCFAFCSMFPLGHEFEKDEVVRLWIAEGLVQCDARRRVEAEGGKFFNELLSGSFFETSSSCSNQKYRVPSLMHELARLVSQYETLSLDTDNPQVDGNCKLVRYASLLHQKDGPPAFHKIYCYENVRTLKICTEVGVTLKHVPSDLFLKLSCLRSLDLSYTKLDELPDSVGHLTHLRYLGLRNTMIEKLPEPVSNLFNLQTLQLSECYRLMELPEGIGHLVNLRHLCLHLEWDRITPMSMPRGIDKLTSLQTLSRFTVTSDDAGDCNLKELKSLNIRGELCILNLEDATNKSAKEANLSGKQHVDNLLLRWGNNTCRDNQAMEVSGEVIESLRPPNKLKCLWIDNYPGRNLPSWIGNNSFSYLETVRISYCRNCEHPPLLGSLPQLKNLRLEGMHGVSSMARLSAFPRLEILTLWDMPDLQTWCGDEEGELPKLRELYICHCTKLQTATHLPDTLAKLEIRNCPKLCSLPVIHIRDLVVEEGGDELIRWISRLTSLASLTLTHFSGTQGIPRHCLQHLTLLKRLKIGAFDKLLPLAGDGNLEVLSSLECLEISSCKKLSGFSLEGLQSLKELRIRFCIGLKFLPRGLSDLGSLRYLEIRDCPNLEIGTGHILLPNNISCLALSGCKALEEWCQGHGADRILQIPDVKIGF